MKKEDMTEDEFIHLIKLLNAFEEALVQWTKIRKSVIGKTTKRPTLQLDIFNNIKEEEE